MENKLIEVVESMIDSLHAASDDMLISLDTEIAFSSKEDVLDYANKIGFLSEKYGCDFFDKAEDFALNFGEKGSKEYNDMVSKCIDKACDVLMERYSNAI